MNEKKELKSKLSSNKSNLVSLKKQRDALNAEIVRIKNDRQGLLENAKDLGMNIGKKAESA